MIAVGARRLRSPSLAASVAVPAPVASLAADRRPSKRRKIDRAVARVLSTAFCVALLAATAVAFALTEGAKTELSPIYGTKHPDQGLLADLQPAALPHRSPTIDFWLRKRQHIEVWMDPRRRSGSRRSSPGRTFPKGEVRLAFDGIADDGVTILPDGTYQPVIRLTGDHRTITLPNPIQLDTTPPGRAGSRSASTRTSRPTATGATTSSAIRYALSGPAHGVLLVERRQAGFTRSQKLHGHAHLERHDRRRARSRRAGTCSRSPPRTRPATARSRSRSRS